jgi:hypothetical protein
MYNFGGSIVRISMVAMLVKMQMQRNAQIMGGVVDGLERRFKAALFSFSVSLLVTLCLYARIRL